MGTVLLAPGRTKVQLSLRCLEKNRNPKGVSLQRVLVASNPESSCGIDLHVYQSPHSLFLQMRCRWFQILCSVGVLSDCSCLYFFGLVKCIFGKAFQFLP